MGYQEAEPRSVVSMVGLVLVWMVLHTLFWNAVQLVAGGVGLGAFYLCHLLGLEPFVGALVFVAVWLAITVYVFLRLNPWGSR